MMKTNYIIKQERDRFAVYQGEVAIAKGLLNEEDCLHAVWVINGKIPNAFYSQECGVVFVSEEPL